jgi:hypothetical protein
VVPIFIVFGLGIGQICSGGKPDLFGRGWALINLGVCSSLLGLHGLCFGRWNVELQQRRAAEFAGPFPTYYQDVAQRSRWLHRLLFTPLPKPLLAVRVSGLFLLLGGGFFIVVGTVRWWNGLI